MTVPASIPLEAAGLLVTDWCPARCRHCYVCAGPDRSNWMTADDALCHLSALARMGVPADGIHIGGGEPFGDFDRLLDIVAAARQAGLAGIGYVETNAYWATSRQVAKERLAALADAGMKRISISTDPYHQEFISPDRVATLFEVATEVLGSQGVRVRRWRWLKQPQDLVGMPENARVALMVDFLRRYPERMTGRAAVCLAPLLERVAAASLPRDGCRRAILESGHVHITPQGYVYPGTCSGISFGQATKDVPLDDVLGRWRPACSPRISALLEGGPLRLLDEAIACGYDIDPAGYVGKCHLCWSLRSHLVAAGAAENDLAPPQSYLTS